MSADQVMANPFLKTYDAVFNLLFSANNPLTGMVKVGNRISFGTPAATDRSVTKQNVSTADLPEIMLIDEGGVANTHANSSAMGFTQNLTLYISTGDFRYGVYTSVINWWILVNMQQWQSLI